MEVYRLTSLVLGILWLAPIIEDPYNPNQAYLAGGGLSGGNHLFHLTAGNSSISYIEEPYSFNSTISAMGYSSIDPNNRYVLTTTGNFYHSNNDGHVWQISSDFEGPGSHYFYGSTIWSSQNTPGKLIIGGSGYSNPPVYISYNHGERFVPFNDGVSSTLVLELAGTSDDEIFFVET